MAITQFDIWIADLNPQIGTEPGKIRPVVIIQTDLLNKALHPSTIICPLSSNIDIVSDIIRVHLKKEETNLNEESDILIDQIRSIDSNRLIKKVGRLSDSSIEKVKENLMIILDLEDLKNFIYIKENH